jgi:mannose-6-phosphate isomerase-like protein (cupin superfamily)
MTEKIRIEDLPVSREFLRQRRIIEPRGELALIEDGQPFRHLGYFSLRKGEGLFRGGHYHLQKQEHFYVVSGKIRMQLVDLETRERSEATVREGQRVTLLPNCAHRFQAEQDAQVIEYYDAIYDPEDDLPYRDF